MIDEQLQVAGCRLQAPDKAPPLISCDQPSVLEEPSRDHEQAL